MPYKDFVKFFEYDKYGRQVKKYLPFEYDIDDNIDDSLINELNPLSNTKLEFSYSEEDTITKYLTFEFGRIIQDGNIIKIIYKGSDNPDPLFLC